MYNAPVHFWDSPAFTTTVVALFLAIIGYLQSKTSKKVDAIDTRTSTIEKHTNGMLTALQTKVDTQQSDAVHLAEITDKDKQIAALSPKPPVT